MNINRKWKRILAVGCSHGDLANGHALAAVLRFVEDWRPVHRIHLGDCYDTAAFRTGANGTTDESHAIGPDITAGQVFLNAFRPTAFCMGNHENRIVKLCGHHNQIIATAANAVLLDMLRPIKKMRCDILPYNIKTGWHRLGNVRFGHGYFYGENYLRDSAESFGNCVVAHAHRAGMAKARSLTNATAYGVGTLADVQKMGYASERRSTLSWSHGMVFGEVCEDEAQLCLWEWPQGTVDWRLPI